MKFSKNFSVLSFMLISGVFSSTFTAAFAQGKSAEDYVGLFERAQKDVVVELKMCKKEKFAARATSICGRVVWDKVGNDENRTLPSDCNRRIVQFNKFENGEWVDGWAFSSETKQSFTAKMFFNDKGELVARTFIGKETQSQDTIFVPVKSYDRTVCRGKRPDDLRIK